MNRNAFRGAGFVGSGMLSATRLSSGSNNILARGATWPFAKLVLDSDSIRFSSPFNKIDESYTSILSVRITAYGYVVFSSITPEKDFGFSSFRNKEVLRYLKMKGVFIEPYSKTTYFLFIWIIYIQLLIFLSIISYVVILSR